MGNWNQVLMFFQSGKWRELVLCDKNQVKQTGEKGVDFCDLAVSEDPLEKASTWAGPWGRERLLIDQQEQEELSRWERMQREGNRGDTTMCIGDWWKQ